MKTDEVCNRPLDPFWSHFSILLGYRRLFFGNLHLQFPKLSADVSQNQLIPRFRRESGSR